MNKNPQNPVIKSKRNRGSALILAVITVVLLFIIGSTFLMTTQTEKRTVATIETTTNLNAAVDAVVEQINEVLVKDLVGSDGNLLNNDSGASDEPYDYPGEADPWLASLEPTFTYDSSSNVRYIWPHITDLWDDFPYFGQWNFPVAGDSDIDHSLYFFDPDNRYDTDQYDTSKWTDSQFYYVSEFNLEAKIIDPEEEILAPIPDNDTSWDNDTDWPSPLIYAPVSNHYSGMRADADGDGVADSRWTRIPNMTAADGSSLYAAVRIIDNSAMINVNTAYRYPDPTVVTTGSPEWDGTRLSHVNLDGIRASGDSFANVEYYLQNWRYGSDIVANSGRPDTDDYANDTQYDDDVARRLRNPNVLNISGTDYYYTPYDLKDELELRNRFFITSLMGTRMGGRLGPNHDQIYGLQVTFDPFPETVGKELPYDLSDTVSNWYDKIKPESDEPTTLGNGVIGDYNRRILATTYNYDRQILPRPQGFTGWPLTDGTETMENTVLAPQLDAWTNWNTGGANLNYRKICIEDVTPTGAGGTPSLGALAAAIWMGLPDGTTLANDPTITALATSTDPILVSTLAAANLRERIACQLAVNLYDYIDNDHLSQYFTVGTNTYYGYESQGHHVYISRLGYTYWNDGTTLDEDYAIVLYNAGPGTADLAGWTISITGHSPYTITGPATLNTNQMYAVFNGTTQGFKTTDFGACEAGAGIVFANNNVITLWDPTGVPSDSITCTGLTNSGSLTGTLEAYDTPDRTRREIDTVEAWGPVAAFNGSEPTVGDTDLNILPAAAANALVAPDFIQNECLDLAAGQYLTSLAEIPYALMIGTVDWGGDILPLSYHFHEVMVTPFVPPINAATTPTALALGRLDMGNPDYQNLLQYLTIKHFSPWSDTVDNDGDGTPDDLDEITIAGRININTAPWFVISQLPWMVDHDASVSALENVRLANAITAYRDMTNTLAFWTPASNVGPDYSTNRTATGIAGVRTAPGFASVAELLNVTNTGGFDPYFDIRRYIDATYDPGNLVGAPDYTADTVGDDLEERDILFQRISNLATVRSDVFTAYILVREGESGPQKRVIAIFDRSNVYTASDRPRLVAMQEVPDPR